MRIIASASLKGGVGKTTTCLNLGAALVERGKKVLLVDLDPQGDLTKHMGYQPNDLPWTVYDLLVHDVPQLPVWDAPRLHLLPANRHLAGFEVEFANEPGRDYILRERLGHYLIGLDYILIDCRPAFGVLTMNALCAANSVLIPVQTQALAYEGMEALLDTIAKVKKRLHPTLKVEGILPTMYDSRRSHDKEILRALRSHYPAYCMDMVIPYRVAIADAFNDHKSVLEVFPATEAAAAFRKLAEVIDA